MNRRRNFLKAARKAISCYARELYYYYRAKVVTPVLGADKGMLIRKRAHHLERYLFKPEAYGPRFGAELAAEIESLIDAAGDTAPVRQVNWAKKILKEYRAMRDSPCGCPLINGSIPAPPSPVDAASLMRLIRLRRTRRIWHNVPLTEEERKIITEAALWTPSSCNRQTLDLIFVEDAELKSFVASTIGGGYQFFNDAPAIIVIVSDARDYRYPDDRTVPFAETGAAIQNIYLVCETMGLGCCWGSYTSFGGAGRENEIRKRLGIPPTHIITGAAAVGKSSQFVCLIPREEPASRHGINGFRRKGA